MSRDQIFQSRAFSLARQLMRSALLRVLPASVFVLWSLCGGATHAAPASGIDHATPAIGPRVALVLEGGGALGFAHVGVLKVLEEARIPIDFITGTSMGSIVGAAYSSGCTIPEMEEVLSTTDWDALFNETPPRASVEYRNKAGRGSELFGDSKIGIKNGEFVVPTALVQGQYVEVLFQNLFGRAAHTTSFDELAIPYRAVAADIETGEAVVLDHGSLALAARASMSVPGFFAPVEYGEHLLVDGGITNNFPVDVALARHPEIIIGVQFGYTFRKRDQLQSPLAISAQILDLLLDRTSQSGLALMRPNDILISPDVSSYTSTSFKSAREIMKAGEEAARLALPRLRALTTSPEQFQAYSSTRTAAKRYAPIIDYIEVENTSPQRASAIREALSITPGKPFDAVALERDLQSIYQTSDLKKLAYRLDQREGKHGLILRAEEKEWLEQYVRLGFSIQDDFDGTNGYALGADVRFNQLNTSGLYADLQAEIGSSPRLFGELYQPLWTGSPFFLAPSAEISSQQLTLLESGDEIAEYRRKTVVLGVDLGISFGQYGELTTGWRRGPGEIEREVGEPTLPEFDYDIGELRSALVIDQYDSVDFPRHGYQFTASNLVAREALGGSKDFEKTTVNGGVPFSYGAMTLLLNGEAGITTGENAVERAYALGGVFDISGFKRASLLADNYWVTRALLYRRIAEGSSSLFQLGGYVGGSVEFASLRSTFSNLEDPGEIVAGSVFLGADTPLLPLYIGYGHSNQDEHTFFLTLGRINPRRR